MPSLIPWIIFHLVFKKCVKNVNVHLSLKQIIFLSQMMEWTQKSTNFKLVQQRSKRHQDS